MHRANRAEELLFHSDNSAAAVFPSLVTIRVNMAMDAPDRESLATIGRCGVLIFREVIHR